MRGVIPVPLYSPHPTSVYHIRRGSLPSPQRRPRSLLRLDRHVVGDRNSGEHGSLANPSQGFINIFIHLNCYRVIIMVGVYIITMKTTFWFKFFIFNNLFKLQVKKEAAIISLFLCLCALMLFESLVKSKLKATVVFIVLIYTTTDIDIYTRYDRFSFAFRYEIHAQFRVLIFKIKKTIFLMKITILSFWGHISVKYTTCWCYVKDFRYLCNLMVHIDLLYFKLILYDLTEFKLWKLRSKKLGWNDIM